MSSMTSGYGLSMVVSQRRRICQIVADILLDLKTWQFVSFGKGERLDRGRGRDLGVFKGCLLDLRLLDGCNRSVVLV